jgi:hypothetical protein
MIRVKGFSAKFHRALERRSRNDSMVMKMSREEQGGKLNGDCFLEHCQQHDIRPTAFLWNGRPEPSPFDIYMHSSSLPTNPRNIFFLEQRD